MNKVRPSTAPRAWRRWLGNLISLGIAIVFCYFVIGSLLLRLLPGLMPTLSGQFPMAASLWWQPSAPEPTNNDYLALLGDSYAEGVGDWKAEQVDVTTPSHSADIIHRLIGRDVLSFGKRGASSAEGLVRLPALALGAGQCLVFPSLQPPQEIVYYFYEGNDLEDNLEFIDERLGLSVGDANIGDASMDFLAHNWQDPGRKPCLLYFGKTIKSLIKTAKKTIVHRYGATVDEAQPLPAPNLARMGSEVVTLPATLQGPALDLDAQSDDAAFEVFEVSLASLQQMLAGVKITVVHLPSVLSTYELTGPSVTVEINDTGSIVHSSADVASRSDAICRRLREITVSSGAEFFDARPAMRDLGTREIIHGPRDWTHFNRTGYTHLGETVAAALMNDKTTNDCGQLASTE
ncbi:Uncharacterised protein [Halioglobus japonicus]|nr:Uncharacterised protein [Halioglobus japonicus]